MLALSSGKVFRYPRTLKYMLEWVPVEDGVYYALGVYGMKLDKRRGFLWGHDGWGGAFMYYWPQKNIVFTGTCNQTGYEEDDSENEWWNLIDEGIRVIEDCKKS